MNYITVSIIIIAVLAHKVTDILLKYNAQLESFLKQQHLEKIANSLHSANIITDDLRDKPVYPEIQQQFTLCIECLKEKQEIEKHCKVFLSALQAVGDPMGHVAEQIGREWKDTCELNVTQSDKRCLLS